MKNFLSALGSVLWTGLLIVGAMLAFGYGYEWIKVLLTAKDYPKSLVIVVPPVCLFASFAYLAGVAYRRIAKPSVCIHHLAVAVGDYLEMLADEEDEEDEDFGEDFDKSGSSDIETLYDGYEVTILRTPDGKGYRSEAVGSGEGDVHIADFYGPDAFKLAEFHALEAYGIYSMDAALSDEVGVIAS